MRLRTKFNLVLLAGCLIGLVIIGLTSYTMLRYNARESVIRDASIMMDAALSMRAYTLKEIKPLLEPQLQHTFLPQAVSAYAATELFNTLRSMRTNYMYKEATLNPTNPRDRATDWEADIVYNFRNHPDRKQIIGERLTPTGQYLYLARPIQIMYEECLTCHSTPDAAPQTMLQRYGASNGFGWQHNEIVGAQIVSVPMALPIRRAHRTFYTFMGSLAGIFLVVFILLNVMLNSTIVRPISEMSHAADAISQGNLTIPEFSGRGKDEVAILAQSFNRLRRSMEKALKLMDEST